MDLAQLIESLRAGRTYRQLSAAGGGAPAANQWNNMAKKQRDRFPLPETIRAAARVLGVSERTIVFAAAESLGLDMSDASDPVELLPVSHLSADQIAVLRSMIEAMGPPEPAVAGQ